MKPIESNEYFQIVDGKKTDRYLHWEEFLDHKPELIDQIFAAKPEDRPALIKKIIDSLK
jgi:hypothetical protein